MIVDVNVYLSRWPFRRTPCDEPDRLVRAMQKHGVGRAWVGSLDGLFHRDIAGVNLRLAEACRTQRAVQWIPFGSVNPMLPDWQEDLRRCAEAHRMPGVRLHPNFHGYRLDAPVAAELFDLAARRKLIVQVALRVDDVRTQHPLMRVSDVDPGPLAELVEKRRDLRLVVLCGSGMADGPLRKRLAATGRVWFDIATCEGVGGVSDLAKSVSPQRVLFGSHLPLFSLESAALKMREADLESAARQAIEGGNARELEERS